MVRVARRGDIWLTDFGDPVGHEQGYLRPGVIVSADGFNEARSGLVFAVPTTTTKRGWHTHVEVDTRTGLRQTSWALVEQLRVTSTDRLRRRIGQADQATMERIVTIARQLLDM
jgi:mRNA interferase MazF